MKTLTFKSFSSLKKVLLSDPEVKRHYDALEWEDRLIRSIIDARLKNKLSQADLAKKVGTGQSAISRLESGGSNPSLAFLQKIAQGLGADLRISFQ